MADSRRANLSAIARRKAWTAATRRRNEIINIAKHRSAQGVSLDQGAFIFGIAQTLASARKGKYRIKSRFVTYHGLDSASLARSVYEAGFGRLGCQIALKVSPLIALKFSPLGTRADVPRSPRLSWSGLLGRGDFGVQCAMEDDVVRRGF